MALTYAAAIERIKTHAVAAGDALTPKILDIDIGAPVKPVTRGVRIFYGGEVDPEKMGEVRTLNSRMIGESIVLVASWVVSTLSPQEVQAVETEMFAFKHELRTRVLADSQLDGSSTDLEMGLCDVGYSVEGNVRFRWLSTEFTAEFADYGVAP
jgi:hypothetical protein